MIVGRVVSLDAGYLFLPAMLFEDENEAITKAYPTFDSINNKVKNNIYGPSDHTTPWLHPSNVSGIRLLFADLLDMAQAGKQINQRNKLFQPWRLIDMFEKTMWDLAKELSAKFKLPPLIEVQNGSAETEVVGRSTSANTNVMVTQNPAAAVVASDDSSDSDNGRDDLSQDPADDTFSQSQDSSVRVHNKSTVVPRSPHTLKPSLHTLECSTPIMARPNVSQLGSGYFSQQSIGARSQSHSYRIDERTPILAQSEL